MPASVRFSTPCSWESWNVSLPSGEYAYGTWNCDVGVATWLSMMADIVMTLPVEPGSNTSEIALDSEPPFQSPGWFGSTVLESAMA